MVTKSSGEPTGDGARWSFGQVAKLTPYVDRAKAWHRRGTRWLTSHLKPLVRSSIFERFVLALILVNAVMLGMETSQSITARFGGLLAFLDTVILTIFVLELAARMSVFGTRFWRDPWSVFDFLVVAITLVPAADNFSVLRALRIVRALRLVSAIPSMRRVVNGLLIAIPGMSSIVVLLLLIFYVFAVMATNMFSEALPDRFGTIGDSLLTLFQVMSLDGWTGEVARPVMAEHSYAWVFFLVFILITSFTVLNLFIGIIVDAMQQQHGEAKATSSLVAASHFGNLKTQFSLRLGTDPGDKGATALTDSPAASPLVATQFEKRDPRPSTETFAIAVASKAQASDGDRIDRLIEEIRALRAEVRALKQAASNSEA